jgi:uncharacterized ferredoxin-like protein
MALIFEEHLKNEAVEDVARKMMIAARTAPKARGIDNIVQLLATGKEVEIIADKMREIGEKAKQDFFLRDADNLLQAQILFLIGTKINSLNLKKCGLCGFSNCAAREKKDVVPCAFNTGDLGIAIGSAVSIAAMHHVDNRIMYTAGLAVVELELLGQEVKIAYGIPLSVSSKNPFFDRK